MSHNKTCVKSSMKEKTVFKVFKQVATVSREITWLEHHGKCSWLKLLTKSQHLSNSHLLKYPFNNICKKKHLKNYITLITLIFLSLLCI